MNAKNRSVARVGLIFSSALAMAATGCATHVHQRTVYVPTPVVVAPPPLVETQSPTPPSQATPLVVVQSENDFREPLNPYGRWVVVAGYGNCWVPAHVEVGWRPYSNGYWQRTDAGWYWMSDEPWGWATYHYGRWDWNGEFGWIWVPQTQWAPAWVAWREGGGYVGWAPLRPSITIGANLTSVNYEPAFASRAFVFVEHRRMLEPVRPKTVVVNNTTIINQTVNITKVKVVNKAVINEGPRAEVIERESGRKVHSVAVGDFRHREEVAVVGRERNVSGSSEWKNQPTVRPAVESRPTPARKEQFAERSHTVTRSTAAVPLPAPAAPISTSRPNRQVVSRGEHKEMPVPVKAHNRATEVKSKPESLAVRSIPNHPTMSTAKKPAGVASPVPAPIIGSPSIAAKSDGTRENKQPAKFENKPKLSKVSRPNATSSADSSQWAQLSPREKSRAGVQAEAPSNGRGRGQEKRND